MKTLAFDITSPIVTVGAAQDGKCLGLRDCKAERSKGNQLDQIVDQLLYEIGWRRNEIEGLGLITGPGSLTASRLGWATAAGWGQSMDIPVAGWTVFAAHRRHLPQSTTGAGCCVQYRGDTFLMYDLSDPNAPPQVVHLSTDSYAARPPRYLTGPGVIGRRETWMSYCGPETRIAVESEAIIGADTLALWAAEDFSLGLSLPLTRSPLDYGVSPDFKKLNSK